MTKSGIRSAELPLPIWHSYASTLVKDNPRQYQQCLLERIPRLLRPTAEKFFQDRQERSGRCPLLGEALPWLIRDLINGSNDDNLHLKHVAWLSLYYAVMISDDLLDQPRMEGKQKGELLLISHLLIQQGTADLVAISSDAKRTQKNLYRTFAKCAEAASEELLARETELTAVSKMSLKLLSKKFAIASLCYSIFAESDSTDSYLARKTQKFWNELTVGLQLLDDITDFDEDLHQRNLTWPVIDVLKAAPEAVAHIKNVDPQERADMCLLVLIQTQALSSVLSEAISTLKSSIVVGLGTFENTASEVWLTLNKLVEELQGCSDEIHKIERLLPKKEILDYRNLNRVARLRINLLQRRLQTVVFFS